MIVIHITCCIFFWYCECVAELACVYWYVCAFYIPAHTFKVFLLLMYIYIVQNTIDRSSWIHQLMKCVCIYINIVCIHVHIIGYIHIYIYIPETPNDSFHSWLNCALSLLWSVK